MILYRLLAMCALLAYSPFALLRSLTGRRALGDVKGRLGRAGYPDLDGGIWVHAVSVGEVGVARSLLSSIARRAPELRLGLSVTTRAGRELAERSAGAVPVFAFPLDLSAPVERALDEVAPGLILLTETELWPLFLERARRRGIPVALVNGRLSEASWRRYMLVRGWFSRVLDGISRFAMQTDGDAQRIRALGAPAERVRVTGNIKYDVDAAPPFADAARLRAAAGGRPVVVAASTGEGEEQLVVSAWKSTRIPSLLALAPRRPERFDTVSRELEREGHVVMRRSQGARGTARSPAELAGDREGAGERTEARPGPDVYLLDSIGELASLYREARLAFLGGSLVPVGGHNPIEAWAAGCPVLVGPHTENFAEVVAGGERIGILRRLAGAYDLGPAIDQALADPAGTAASGARAESFVAENRGAADATVEEVLPLLARRPPGPTTLSGRGVASPDRPRSSTRGA